MGMESGWDAKQLLGTVPVEDDGSVSFKIPANSPISLQPLDKNGKALQLMRSWLVGMPGERLSCVGCHESQNMTPPTYATKAMRRQPDEIKDFYGPARGFSFEREILPIIHKYCAGCHDGTKDLSKLKEMGVKVADRIHGTGPDTGKRFSKVGIPHFNSNAQHVFDRIHPYVRRNGPEGDYHLLTPLEFHTDTSELLQMLEKGHHNVKLDRQSYDKLVAWIDLNAPLRGTWTEAGANPQILERRMELRKLYAFDHYNPETIVNAYTNKAEFVAPPKPKNKKPIVKVQKSEVRGKRSSAGMELDLGDEVKMKLVSIPAGEFSMGSNGETPHEQPVSRVKITKDFMMGATEVTLRQFRQFKPDYLNGVYDMHYKDQVKRGYYMNDMDYPVIRVTWQEAMEFCEWLSEETGKKVSLPTEAQWEWACKAGSTTPLSYGGIDTDFSKHANFSDITVKQMAVKGVNPRPISNPNWQEDFKLKDPRFNDGVLHLAEVGKYQPNTWGLHDMHGNAAEWTRSMYYAYPYKDDARNKTKFGSSRVVRGGSWHDRPFRSTSTYRLGFTDWQRVYNVGFRVVVELRGSWR
jgi:formylglycine-generating enzyme required for sulfatase activity